MKIRFFFSTLVFFLMQAPNASALTMKEVYYICQSTPGDCSENQIVKAYVGGALDLIITLDEKTDYLKKVYCKNPKSLMNVTNIIHYMGKNSNQYADDNAMLVVIRYFEEHGGC